MKLEQRRRVKCINHYWYVRDDFFISDTNKEIVCRVFFIAITIRDGRIKEISYSRADGFIWQNYLPSSFETEENWRLSRPFFFFFLCEKNLTRKMTREWTKSKERNWSNSTFLSFFLFFFLFIKKITMKCLSFESKTIRLMETCRFNIPRHSSQSSIVREIKITGSA